MLVSGPVSHSTDSVCEGLEMSQDFACMFSWDMGMDMGRVKVSGKRIRSCEEV